MLTSIPPEGKSSFALEPDNQGERQWWELTNGRRALPAGRLPNHQIVRVIDDRNENRDLLLCAETQIGQGRLILAGFDRPVARTFRKALSDYLGRDAAPAPATDRDSLARWWRGATE